MLPQAPCRCLSMSRPAASVIVSTYNRPGALAAVLRGLLAQSRRDFEVLVSDDGSGPPTREVARGFMTAFEGRLHYLWHEDRDRGKEPANRERLQEALGTL